MTIYDSFLTACNHGVQIKGGILGPKGGFMDFSVEQNEQQPIE